VAIPLVLWQQLTILNAIAVLFITLLSVGIFVFQTKKKENSFKLSLPLIGLGLTLMILPACLLMQSVKYQQTLAYGFGYLPVFIQNFGTAMLLAYLFAFVVSCRRNLILPIVLLLAVCTASVSSFLFNKAISKTREYQQSLPLQSQWQSVQNGILSSCPEGSYILLGHDYIYKAPFIYSTIFTNLTGKKFKVYDLQEWNGEMSDSSSLCYIFDCQKGDTIYNRLYQMNCLTGGLLRILKTDTFHHKLRLANVEEPLLRRNY